jgi:hypothetical protein
MRGVGVVLPLLIFRTLFSFESFFFLFIFLVIVFYFSVICLFVYCCFCLYIYCVWLYKLCRVVCFILLLFSYSVT